MAELGGMLAWLLLPVHRVGTDVAAELLIGHPPTNGADWPTNGLDRYYVARILAILPERPCRFMFTGYVANRQPRRETVMHGTTRRET